MKTIKQYCLLCHDFQAAICLNCQKDLKAIYYQAEKHCPICSRFSVNQAICGQCQQNIPPYRYLWASSYYQPPIPNLLHEYKHLHYTAYQKVLTHIMLDNPPPWLAYLKIDAVLAMPISKMRRLYRGFNQSDELAQAIAQHYSLPLLPHDWLIRKHKAPQSTLTYQQRQRNIKHSFQFNPRYTHSLHQKTILIIDDIVTTNASISELSRVLIQAGSAQVLAWVVATNLAKKID